MVWRLSADLTRGHVTPFLSRQEQASLRVNRTLLADGAHVRRALLLEDMDADWTAAAEYSHRLDHSIQDFRALRSRIKIRRQARREDWRRIMSRLRTYRTTCVRCGMLDNPESEVCESSSCRWRKHARCVRCTVIVPGNIRYPLCTECGR